jgi:group II intron reverse transcriptase/maturase
MIPKPGKPGKYRPLGIPTVKDRVVQAALLQVLEPIFEAGFLSVSYGFRPKRACRDALEHIRISICPAWKKEDVDWPRPPYEWVIEGDIKGCFDNIDHHVVMTRLRRRVHDRKVCRVVLAFLKAGILHNGAFKRTKTGTPQGGVLSPLLANIVLSAIEERYGRFTKWSHRKDGKPYAHPGQELRKFRRRERLAGRTVFLPIRYADDFVILVYGTEEQARAEKESLAVFLDEELKMTLSPEKTHVTALT